MGKEATEKLLTVAEAAAVKGVTKAAVYGAVKDGRLPHDTVLNRIGLRETDVTAWQPVAYRGRAGAAPRGGRPAGAGMSDETRGRIAAGQSRRWAQRKGETA